VNGGEAPSALLYCHTTGCAWFACEFTSETNGSEFVILKLGSVLPTCDPAGGGGGGGGSG
jgi:hypothetical protein